MFEIESLKPYFLSKEESEFMRVLLETNRVRYDWGNDYMWVWSGDLLNPLNEEDAHGMSGEDFHEKMRLAYGSVINWPTAAGFVVDMIACGINVQIAKNELFAPDYLPHLVECASEKNPNGKAGCVDQFVPKVAVVH